MNGIWPVVHAERAAQAEDLQPLTGQAWSTPSLCPGWDVHDVVAHLVDDARQPGWGSSAAFWPPGVISICSTPAG